MFIDIDDINPGEDFAERIERALEACHVALILIGPRWLAAAGDRTRRIDAADDLFRQEVRAALAHPEVTVVPVLVEGASMPEADELPDDIAAVTKLNAFELSNRHWDYDLGQLAGFIERYDDRWHRVRHRAPGLLIRASPVVALAIAAAVVGILSGGGGAGASSGGGAGTKLAHEAACERTHGMTSSQVARQPRPGESHFTKSDVTPPYGGQLEFLQTSYASCNWPPPPGADTDGYRTIIVTLTNGPGQSDGSGRDFADVIEFRCGHLQLTYNEAMMGNQEQWQPFTAAPGDIWAPAPASGTAAPLRFVKVGELGAPSEQGLQLPFYPETGDVVVLHGQQQLQSVSCLA